MRVFIIFVLFFCALQSLADKGPQKSKPSTKPKAKTSLTDKKTFIRNEVSVMRALEDDVVLGEVTERALMKYRSFEEYEKLLKGKIQLEINKDKAKPVNSFLKDYKDKFKMNYQMRSYDTTQFAEIPSKGNRFSPAKTAFMAASSGDIESLRAVLDNYPKVLRARDKDKNTLLHVSAASSHYLISKILLLRSLSPIARNAYGHRPVDLACIEEDKTCRLLAAAASRKTR